MFTKMCICGIIALTMKSHDRLFSVCRTESDAAQLRKDTGKKEKEYKAVAQAAILCGSIARTTDKSIHPEYK